MLVCCDKKVCTYVCIAIVFFICLEAGLRIRDGAPHPKRILLFQQGKNFVNYGSVSRFQVQSATPSPWVLASSKKTS